MLGLTQVQEVKLWHSAFLCICRLTLEWISSEISTKLLGMQTHLDRSSLTAAGLYIMPTGHFCCPVSTPSATLRRPSPTAFSEFLCPTPDSLSLPTSGCVEISSSNTLSGYAPKQTNGWSAWRTTYIVSQDSVRTLSTVLADGQFLASLIFGLLYSILTHIPLQTYICVCVCICVYACVCDWIWKYGTISIYEKCIYLWIILLFQTFL